MTVVGSRISRGAGRSVGSRTTSTPVVGAWGAVSAAAVESLNAPAGNPLRYLTMELISSVANVSAKAAGITLGGHAPVGQVGATNKFGSRMYSSVLVALPV